MVTRRAFVALFIVYSIAEFVVSDTESNYESHTNTNKDRLSERQTTNKDSNNVHSDTKDYIKDVNSENIKRDLHNEHLKHHTQTYRQVSSEQESSNDETQTGHDTVSDSEKQQFEHDHVEQQQQGEQGIDSKSHTVNVETRDGDDGDDVDEINTEPVFPDENLDRVSTELKEAQPVLQPDSNIPSTEQLGSEESHQEDFASEQVNADENIQTHDNGLEKSRRQEFHDVSVQQENEMYHEAIMESRVENNKNIEEDQLVDDSENQGNVHEESQVDDNNEQRQINDDNKQTDSEAHMDNVRIDKASQTSNSFIELDADMLEKLIGQKEADLSKDSKTDINIENVNSFIQDTLHDDIKVDESIQDIPQENGDEMRKSMDEDNENQETSDDTKSEFTKESEAQDESGGEEAIKDVETQDDVSSEPEETVDDGGKQRKINSGGNVEEFVFVERGKDEPQTSNIPGTRYSKKEKLTRNDGEDISDNLEEGTSDNEEHTSVNKEDGEENHASDGEENHPSDGEENHPSDGEENHPSDGEEEEDTSDGEENHPLDGEEEEDTSGEEYNSIGTTSESSTSSSGGTIQDEETKKGTVKYNFLIHKLLGYSNYLFLF